MAQKSDASGRFYDFPDDPNKYVSVTTFLGIIGKPFLISWAAKMERELIRLLAEQGKSLEEILEYLQPKQPYAYSLYTESTSELGSKVHKAIDYTLKDLKLPKLTKKERRVYDKWLEWWKAQKFELVGAERVTKSKRYGYAGTLDALVIKDGKSIIIDWKTGKNHYAEHDLQNIAYQYALLHEEGLAIDGGQLVYIRDEKEIDDKYKIERVNNENVQPVLEALSLWRWANKKPWKGDANARQ
jgi:CRISPR/Cas system-associated exonuclease Cas4 (RecB family)